jgi:hypothetical protein
MYKGNHQNGEIEIIKEVKVYENRFCDFYNDEVLFPSGSSGNFLRLAMKGKYSVAVLPITKDGKMVFIKNDPLSGSFFMDQTPQPKKIFQG